MSHALVRAQAVDLNRLIDIPASHGGPVPLPYLYGMYDEIMSYLYAMYGDLAYDLYVLYAGFAREKDSRSHLNHYGSNGYI